MKKVHAVVLAAVVVLLSACASTPRQPIPMSEDALVPVQGRVGVAMTRMPKVDTHLPGAGCLLCVAAASMANSSLTTHAQTLPLEDLPQLKNQVADLLRKKGVDAVVLPEDLDVDALKSFDGESEIGASQDFRPLREKYNIEKLVVITIQTLGFERQYSSYIPVSEPKGVLRGTGYMVNLRNNNYVWFLPVEALKSAEMNWDEAPKFPGLTNAYFQVLETGKDQFLKPFIK